MHNIKSIRAQRLRADFLRERIACIRADIERITAVPRNGGGGTPSDKMAGAVAKLVDLQREYVAEVAEIENSLQAAELALCALPEQQALIMRLRYIEGLSWANVARRAGLTCRHCLKIHEKAISNLQQDTK